MYCTKCGSQVAEEDKFCSKCGTALKTDESCTALEAVQSSAERERDGPDDDDEECRKIFGTIKSYAGSLFLVPTILYTIYVIMEIKSGAFSIFSGIFSGILSLMGLDTYAMDFLTDILSLEDIMNFIGVLNLPGFLLQIVLNLPEVLVLIGMWLIYFSARNTKRIRVSSTGFSMIQLLIIIRLLVNMLIYMMVIFSLIQFSAYFSGETAGIMWLVIIGCIVAAIIYAYYNNKLYKTLSALGCAGTEEYHSNGISSLVIFVFIVNGIFSLMSSGFSISGICLSVSQILIGYTIYACKQKIEKNS